MFVASPDLIFVDGFHLTEFIALRLIVNE